MGAALMLSAMAAVFLSVLGALGVLMRGSLEQSRRLDGLAERRDTDSPRRGVRQVSKLLPQGVLRLLGRSALEGIGDELYVAGVALKPEEFVTIWLAAGIGLPLLLEFLGISWIACAGLAGLLTTLPVLAVRLLKLRRLRAFDAQLMDAITIICNSLHAGFSIQTAISNISHEMEDPIRREFARVATECRYGLSLEDSLRRLAKRTGNDDLELVVSAISIQKQVGGNLAEVLSNVSKTVGQRIALHNEVKVLTSQGRLSGYVIGLMPIFLAMALMVINPGYIEDFIATNTGRMLLGVAAGMEVVGFIAVRRVIHIKF